MAPERESGSLRKRLVVVGQSREALELLPGLEANPDVEIVALAAEDPERARRELAELDSGLAARLGGRVTPDVDAALATPELAAVVEAEPSPAQQAAIARTSRVPVTTPALARLLFAYGPAGAMSRPDLLQALREILDSFDLTLDWRRLLERVLQIAITSTGADRGSLMLFDPEEGALRVEVAHGIEEALLHRIRVSPGEGIAGRAYATGAAIRLDGKADRRRYRIVRERDDVESAISAPLVHGERVIGVLNLSHGRDRGVFDDEDVGFVEQLARLDARVIDRAQEYQGLVRESEGLRTAARVRSLLTAETSLPRRLQHFCRWLGDSLPGGVCRLYLYDAEQDALLLQAASTRVDPTALPERIAPGRGVAGGAAASGRIRELRGEDGAAVFALPLVAEGALVGVLQAELSAGPEDEDPTDRLHAAGDALAGELAKALAQGRREREAARRAALGACVAAFGSCRSAEALHARIAEAAAELLQAQDVVLRLRDEESGRFRIAAWTGLGEWRKTPVADLEKRLASDAVREGRTLRVAPLHGESAYAELAAGVGTALAEPLVHEGRAVGSLSAIGRVPDEPFLGERFGADDEDLLRRLARHAEAALASDGERTRRTERFDADTGLPKAEPLRERVAEELARSRLRGHAFALVELELRGLAGPPAARTPAEGARLARRLAAALRGALRDFDVLARVAPDRFAVLAPEPEGEVTELLADLWEAVRASLGSLADALVIRSGYARYPEDGEDPDLLLGRAAETRVEAL